MIFFDFLCLFDDCLYCLTLFGAASLPVTASGTASPGHVAAGAAAAAAGATEGHGSRVQAC